MLLLLLFAGNSSAGSGKKFVSIIIDDIGNNFNHGLRVVNFPAALTLAILPKTTFSRELAELADRQNKEVMLHLPLQAIGNHKHSPGTLHLHMTQQQFTQHLHENIASVPHVRGINNHMGSLLTQHPGHMDWLMSEVAQLNDIYFIDSRTTKNSVAAAIASEHNIPNLVRDVFLDPDFKPSTLKIQFDRLISIALKKGYAIALAHPHRSTMNFLRDNYSRLQKNGIELVPVSRLIQLQEVNQNVTCTGPTCTGL